MGINYTFIPYDKFPSRVLYFILCIDAGKNNTSSDRFEKTIQRKIYELIKKNPGIYLTKIVELLNIKITDVNFWLQDMEEKNFIHSTNEEGYKRYFIKIKNVQNRDQRTLEMRNEIYQLVEKNPGLYLTKIAEMLHLSVQLADYHLLQMERSKEIIAVKNKGEYYRRYYTVYQHIQNDELKILYLLGNKISLEIVLYLIKHHTLRQKELAEYIGISRSRLSYHLMNLQEGGIVNVCSHGEAKGYTLVNIEFIVTLLKKYRIKLEFNSAIDEFVDIWRDFFYDEQSS